MDSKLLALVALGGAMGAVLRYSIQSMVGADSAPYATLGVNLVGSLLLGVLFGAIAAGTVISEGSVLLVGTGLLGAFTTMSTFAKWTGTSLRGMGHVLSRLGRVRGLFHGAGLEDRPRLL